MSLIRNQILNAIRSAAAERPELPGELEFRDRVARHLPESKCELRVEYIPVQPHKVTPDESDERILRARALWDQYPKDPCGVRARLDLLWLSNEGPVAIELKCIPKWHADTQGYAYMRDLYRLERMCAIRGVTDRIRRRFAAFVTSERVYWDPASKGEPEVFRICEGRRLYAGYWVQYTQPSPQTRWIDYPPFSLANPYEFSWADIGNGVRLLLTEVSPRS